MDRTEIENKVSQSSNDLTELKATVKQLLARVDRQALVVHVLKEMVLSQGGLSEDEFHERLTRAVVQKADERTCRKCGKVLIAKHKRCLYCGEERPPDLL